MIGKRFGEWLVLSGPLYNSAGDTRWLARCSCGTEKEVSGYQVRKGQSKSCGCKKQQLIRDAKRKGQGITGRNQLFLKYKLTAKAGGREWSLDIGEFTQLTSGYCFYCGTPPERTYYNSGCKSQEAREYGGYRYNGIDRLNNSRGYIRGNCVACCWPCNRLKSARNADEFLSRIKRIYENHFSKDTVHE